MDTREQVEMMEFVPIKTPGFKASYGIYVRGIMEPSDYISSSGRSLHCGIMWSRLRIDADSYGRLVLSKEPYWKGQKIGTLHTEVSWLELLVITGQSKNQAIEAWLEHWGEKKKWQIRSLINAATGTT